MSQAATEKNSSQGRTITRPEGIYRLLQSLKSKHSSLGLNFASVADSYTSLILAVNYKEGFFLLDEVTPKWGDNLMAKAVPFSLIGFSDGCKITIENLQATGRAVKEGSPVYKVPFPKKLHFLQRRQFFRAQIRLSLKIKVQLGVTLPVEKRDEYDNLLPPDPPTWLHEGVLRDLSAQGCQIELEGDYSTKLEKNTCYPLCYITFPNGERLEIEITLRHLDYDPITKITSLGCQFTQLDQILDRRISFIVNELQRDQARTASGNTSAPVSNLFIEAAAPEVEEDVKEEKTAEEFNLNELVATAIANVEQLVANLKNRQPLNIKETQAIAKILATALADQREELILLTRVRTPDKYLSQHSLSVGILLADLIIQDANNPNANNKNYLADLIFAGLCHDLGKGLIPEQILTKRGELSPAEYKIMHKHSLLTREILSRQQGTPEIALTLATQNCERLDGSGHPEGLKAISISPLGKLAAVIDVFDAMTNTRSYQKAMPYPSAYKALLSMQTKLDQNLVKQLIRTQGIYPLGSLVSLENGDLGFVISQNEDASPKELRLVYNSLSKSLIPPKVLNLNTIEGTKPKLKPESIATHGLNPELILE